MPKLQPDEILADVKKTYFRQIRSNLVLFGAKASKTFMKLSLFVKHPCNIYLMARKDDVALNFLMSAEIRFLTGLRIMNNF